MKSFIVDSSVALKWLDKEREQDLEQAEKLLSDFQNGNVSLYMPELAKYEIGNALRYKRKSLSLILVSLETFYTTPISYITETLSLAQNAMDIAKKSDITYYDASFISLAIEYKAPLITANPKHHRKYKGKDVKIIPLAEYK